jgi:ribosome-binding protein aMBF1 (putative translation factor)
MATRTTQMADRCAYCGKRLVVQNELGENADGNRVVIEVDGSRKRACRSCADMLSSGSTASVPLSKKAPELRRR